MEVDLSEKMPHSGLPDSQTPLSRARKPVYEEPTSPRDVHGWRWAIAAASVYIGSVIYGLDGTIAADIQPAIIEQFGSVEKLSWIGTAFPLGSVCAIMPGAALYQRVNLKVMFIASIVLFEAASALCGAAPTMNALIIGRAIAGVGGTGIYLGLLNYFSLCTTEKERGNYIAGVGVAWGSGAVLGPVVGGAFATSPATWRWAFYINLVIAAICAPAYIFFLPSVKPHGTTKLSKLDWAGFIGGTGVAVSLTMALTFAGSTWDWNDSRTIATFVVCGVLVILTFLQQRYYVFTTSETRMFPPQYILLDRTQVLLGINTAMAATNLYVPVYYLPLYFSFTQGDSELKAAVRLLPLISFLAAAVMLCGDVLPKINYYWTIYMTGGILMTIGSATMLTVTANTPVSNIYGYSILMGAGTGLVVNLGFTVSGLSIMATTGNSLDVQRVVSLQNISQLGFQTMSLLIGGQIFQSLAFKNLSVVLADLDFSKAQIESAIAGTRSSVFTRLSPTVQEKAITAITQGIARVYILSTVASAMTILCALMMKKERLFPARAK